MSMFCRPLAAAAAAFLCAAGVEAKFGLRASENYDRVNREVVVKQLQEELRALLGHGESHERLRAIEERLRPTFVALPKGEDGGLAQGTARYVLQRYFVAQHGWQVAGLERSESRANESAGAAVLKSKMPGVVLELFERRLEGQRVGLEELAVLVATVEDLAHSDMISLLEDVYGMALAGVTEDDWGDDISELVLRGMLLWYTMPEARKVTTSTITLRRAVRNAHRAYLGWDGVLLWAQDLESALAHEDRTFHSPFSPFAAAAPPRRDFRSLGRLVGSINERFGQFQNLECKALKNKLLDLEDERRRDGRVALSKFYGGHLNQGLEAFSESPGYLRHLGALDESDPERPSVIVANYVYGRSNCIATSSFISVCCINECEALMSGVEDAVARPSATAGELAAVVSRLSSDTVPAPRNLSEALLERLDEVAASHGGAVPLHGRLFAQWMHLAFPNECPFPQAPGSAGEQLSIGQYNLQQNDNLAHQASREEMRLAVEKAEGQNATTVDAGFDESQLPWLHEEEMLHEQALLTLQESGFNSTRRALRFVCMIMAICGSMVLFVGMRGSLQAAQKRRRGVLPCWEEAACGQRQVRFV